MFGIVWVNWKTAVMNAYFHTGKCIILNAICSQGTFFAWKVRRKLNSKWTEIFSSDFCWGEIRHDNRFTRRFIIHWMFYLSYILFWRVCSKCLSLVCSFLFVKRFKFSNIINSIKFIMKGTIFQDFKVMTQGKENIYLCLYFIYSRAAVEVQQMKLNLFISFTILLYISWKTHLTVTNEIHMPWNIKILGFIFVFSMNNFVFISNV